MKPQHDNEKSPVTSANCTLVGFGYFITRPNLWLAPLAATLLCVLTLIAVFIFVAYFSWPKAGNDWFPYTWGIVKSFGYGSIAVLTLWVSLFPIILNVAFERMCCKILHENNRSPQSEGMARAMVSSINVIFRTLGWRIFWPVISVIAIFFFGPLAIFLAQIGIGHIAIIDGCDLSLSVQGVRGRNRVNILKKRTVSVLLAGVVAGILSMLLTPTFIGLIFWLPGVYTGTVLWTLTWGASELRTPADQENID